MLGFDTETALIAEAKLAPELACLTFSDGERSDIIHHADTALPKYVEWLLNQETTTANGAYDLAVLWAHIPDMRDLIWDAVGAGRVHDVLIRQKLLDLGQGVYRRVFRRLPGDEKATLLRYSLSDVHARYYDCRMEKDEWRLRYGELRQLPLSQWPPGAVRYATGDAEVTVRVHHLQDMAMEGNPRHNLWDEIPQVRAAWALHLMSCWGFYTDLKRVTEVIEDIEAEMPDLAKALIAEDLIRWDGGDNRYKRREKNAKVRMYAAVGDAGELTDTGYKAVKAGKMTKDEALRAGYIKIDEEWCESSNDPTLVNYFHFRQNQLLLAKLRNIRRAAKGGAQGTLPVQTQFEVLLETGRTSSSENKLIENSMALQNPPRKGGFRSCFRARPGCTLIAADYGQAELVSLAQVTYSAFGFSKMRDLLNASMDIHVDFGKEVWAARENRVITYDDAWALHKAKDAGMKEYRQLAKCFHGDTEVLTRTGWVKLSELREGVEVAAASFSDGGNTYLRWEMPTQLTTRQSDELVHLVNENIDLWVTPDHRMAFWKSAEKNPLPQIRDPKTGRVVPRGGRQMDKHLVHDICMPEELWKKRSWPSAGVLEGGEQLDFNEHYLRLAVAVQADGNYAKNNAGETGVVRLGFTKKRKIERLRWLLSCAQVAYEEKLVGSAKVTTFIIRAEASAPVRQYLDPDKTFPWWWVSTTKIFREIVLDEARHWDAHITNRGAKHWLYFSSIEKNAEIMQALASITGRKATKRRSAENGNGCWAISVKNRTNTRGGNMETIKAPWGGAVYCLTVPSDAVLVRYNGKTTVTHQCADFGFPGGLGSATFQSYARKAWGVELTFDQSKELRRYWLNHFPEMREYFAWISRLLEEGGGTTAIQQYMSKRWRGRCRYTQAANGLFQALTADAAKAACFEVARLCYTVKSSDLYGCRPLLFVHDEIITEAPREQAAAAAKEQERVMVEVYKRYTPDVLITADAHLMDSWFKDAEAVYDERGKLMPWSPPEIDDERFEERGVAWMH